MKTIKLRPKGFIDVPNRRGFNFDHGTRYSITDLQTNREKGANRLPRRDSQYWDDSRYMIWDVSRNCKIN